MMEGSRKRRPRNVPARMAEYISDFVVDESPSSSRSSPLSSSSSSSSQSNHHDNAHHPATPPPSHPSKHHHQPTPNTPPADDKDENSNHDLCDSCGDGGDLICCDRCPASFHLLCVEPPLPNNAVPEGDWFCKQCTAVLYPPPASYFPRNPIAAALLKKLNGLNPHIYTLPKDIYEAAKKGKVFTADGEGGRQVGSGATGVDAFGNKYLQGVCSICTIEGKQTDLIACSACKTLYHTYCMDPVLTAKPSGFWVCPNHDPNYVPPHVKRVLKSTTNPNSSRQKEVTHYLPGETMRLNFVPSPFEEYDSDDSDSDDSSGDGSSSDDSGRKSNKPKESAFEAMKRSLQNLKGGQSSGDRRDSLGRKQFNAFTFLDDYYDEEAFEEIDLYTPPEDQTRLLLNLSRPQRLRYSMYDSTILKQSKQLEDLLQQQATYARAAMPSTFSAPSPSSSTISSPSAPSMNGVVGENKTATDTPTNMDLSSPSSPTTPTSPTLTFTSTTTTSSPNPNSNSTPSTSTSLPSSTSPLDAIFANGLGSPLALAQLSPLFTQFLAWQRLMQVNQQIQCQSALPNLTHDQVQQLQVQQQLQQQQQEQSQIQQLQAQQKQLRQYYEAYENHQPELPLLRSKSAYNSYVLDVANTPRYAQEHLRASATVARVPRVPPRAKSPRSKPFANSSWMRNRIEAARAPPPPTPAVAKPALPPTRPTPTSTPTPIPTHTYTHTHTTPTPAPKPIKIVNQTSSYGKPTIPPFDLTTRTSIFSTPSSDHVTSPEQTPTSDTPNSAPPKGRGGRKRKEAPIEAPTSPRKSLRRAKKDAGEEGEGEDEGEAKAESKLEEAEANKLEASKSEIKRKGVQLQLRGKGGRFVPKDPTAPPKNSKNKTKPKADASGKPKVSKEAVKEEAPKAEVKEVQDESKGKVPEETKDGKGAGTKRDAEKETVNDTAMAEEHEEENSGIEHEVNEEMATEMTNGEEEQNGMDPEAPEMPDANSEEESEEEEEEENDKDSHSEPPKPTETLSKPPAVVEPKRSTRVRENRFLLKQKEEEEREQAEAEKKKDKKNKKKKDGEVKEGKELEGGKKKKIDSTTTPTTPPPTTTTTTATVTTDEKKKKAGGKKKKEEESEESEVKPTVPEKPATIEKATIERPLSERPPTEWKAIVVPLSALSGVPRETTNENNNNNSNTNSNSNINGNTLTNSLTNSFTNSLTNSLTSSSSSVNTGLNTSSNSLQHSPSLDTIYLSNPSILNGKSNKKHVHGTAMPITPELNAILLDKTVYENTVASLVVSVIEPNKESERPPPQRYNITKRVTSIGRNRQTRQPDASPATPGSQAAPTVDIDLTTFGQYAKAVSHNHAYIVYSPLDRKLPEYSLFLVGRNLTKVNGVLYRDGILHLPSPTIIKLSKLKLEFSLARHPL